MVATQGSQVREERGGYTGEASRDLEQWFISELPTIDAATASIARGHRLSADETHELKSRVYVRLIDNDYAALRKFAGRSSLRAYLNVVIRRILLDTRVSTWGKWRVSAEAKREGLAAALLDRLTTRQGLTFDQACHLLETVHGIDLDRPALAALHARLPIRIRRQMVDDEVLQKLPDPSATAEDFVAAGGRRRVARQASQILAAELAGLSPDDRRILQLRFVEGLTMGVIGERLGCRDIKALYRRVRRLLDGLRTRLEAAGLERAEVLDVIGGDGVTVPRLLALPPGSRSRIAPAEDRRPSLRRRSG